MFFTLLLTYLLGGLTFLPLLLTIGLACVYYHSTPIDTPLSQATEEASLKNESSKQKHKLSHHPGLSHSSSSTLLDSTPLNFDLTPELPRLYRAGWLTVRHSYESSSSSESGYMGLITNSYRNFIDNRSHQSRRTRSKDQFYSVLKQNVLFLYPDEDQVECTAAIKVSLHRVELHPSGSPDPELFVKRKAICLTPIHAPSSSIHPSPSHPPLDPPSDLQSDTPSPWFIFTKNNLEKEDWYHLLVAASKLAHSDSKTTFKKDASLFDSQDMAKLVEGIDQQPDPIPMRWMNAMLGRLFLSIYRTHAFENWIIDRIMKKLTKIQTPSFLSAINVREVNVGSTTPFFSKPMLKELTVDGDASMEVLVSYKGQFRITIETVATINLGARFKPYVVNLVLAVVLKELSGTLLLKIKRPPTNRLWFGFTTMPHLILDLQPVVSTRQIKWALVLKPIESRIREVVMESLVYPNLDDLVFFDTQPYTHHGGIWGDAARKSNSTHETGDEQTSDVSAQVEEPKPTNHQSTSSYQELKHQNSLSTAREDSSRLQDTLRLRSKSSSLTDSSFDSIPVGEPDSPSNPLINQPENKRSSWFSTARRHDTVSTQSSQNSTFNQPKIGPTPLESSELEDGDAVAMLQKFLRSHPESSVNSSALPTPTSDGISSTVNASVSQPDCSLSLSDPLEIDFKAPIDASSNKLSQAEPPQLTEGSTDQKVNSDMPSLTKEISNNSKNTLPLRPVPPPPPQSLPSTFLPPPHRMAPPIRAPNAPNNQTSHNSILNQLRTRATDKEAIAASVTQARDVVIKWGASWASKRKSPQATHSMYPYNSGFNPIIIDQAEQHEDSKASLIPSIHPADQTNSSIDSTDTTKKNISDDPQNVLGRDQEGVMYHPEESSPNRAGMTTDDVFSFPLSKSNSSTASPFQNEVSLEDESSSQQDKREFHSISKPNSTTNHHHHHHHHHHNEESHNHNVNGKRNKIFSSNGQFVLAAPQSTTGLSIHSSPRSNELIMNSNGNNSKTKLVSQVDEGSTPTANTRRSGDSITQELTSRNTPPPMRKKSDILSERSGYRPAPVMAIPGIKDSSHRFGLGSDSISRLSPKQSQSSPSSGASGGMEYVTPFDNGLGLTNLKNSQDDPNFTLDHGANETVLKPSSTRHLTSQPVPVVESIKLRLDSDDDDDRGRGMIEKDDLSNHPENKRILNEHDGDEDQGLRIESNDSRLENDGVRLIHESKSHDDEEQVEDSSQFNSRSFHEDGMNLKDDDERKRSSLMENVSDSPVDHLAWGF